MPPIQEIQAVKQQHEKRVSLAVIGRDKNKEDNPFKTRLSRRQLFQLTEDRQVLIPSTDIDKYMVPKYQPPKLPPKQNRENGETWNSNTNDPSNLQLHTDNDNTDTDEFNTSLTNNNDDFNASQHSLYSLNNNLQQQYDAAIKCIHLCESIITTLQHENSQHDQTIHNLQLQTSQLMHSLQMAESDKEEELARARRVHEEELARARREKDECEERLVEMSLELARAKSLEDEYHLVRRRLTRATPTTQTESTTIECCCATTDKMIDDERCINNVKDKNKPSQQHAQQQQPSISSSLWNQVETFTKTARRSKLSSAAESALSGRSGNTTNDAHPHNKDSPAFGFGWPEKDNKDRDDQDEDEDEDGCLSDIAPTVPSTDSNVTGLDIPRFVMFEQN